MFAAREHKLSCCAAGVTEKPRQGCFRGALRFVDSAFVSGEGRGRAARV